MKEKAPRPLPRLKTVGATFQLRGSTNLYHQAFSSSKVDTGVELSKEDLERFRTRIAMEHVRLAKIEMEAAAVAIEALAKAPKITRPPAHRATEILRFIFPKAAFDAVFSQVVLDMREEYFAALRDRKIGLARWRHIQLWWVLLATFILWLGASSLRKMFDLWKALS